MGKNKIAIAGVESNRDLRLKTMLRGLVPCCLIDRSGNRLEGDIYRIPPTEKTAPPNETFLLIDPHLLTFTPNTITEESDYEILSCP